MKGRLFVPLSRDRYFDIQLNPHTVEVLERKKVRSLTITPDRISFCYSEDVEPSLVKTVHGVDRNEKNLTFGDKEGVNPCRPEENSKDEADDERGSKLHQEE